MPPVLPGHPLKQLAYWTVNPLHFLETYQQRYGDAFTSQMGARLRLTFLSNPAHIAQVFNTDPTQMDAGSSNVILRPTVGDFSLLLLDGPAHERQRKLLMPPFHGDRMRSYGDIIQALTDQAIEALQPGQTFIARDLTQTISLQVILRTVFGVDAEAEAERSQQLCQRLQELVEYSVSPLLFAMGFFPQFQRPWGGLWRPWVIFQQKLQALNDLLYATIADRRAAQAADPDHTRTDILSLLLAARDEAGEPMTDVELRDELITLLLAGHETTATALSWALYWMQAQPEVLTKLREELAIDADGMTITKLPYLNAFCSEVLRIYPIALIVSPRQLRQPMDLGSHQFEAGTLLAPCIYLTHRRPDLYPNPEVFRPERFLERSFSPSEYFPFGGSNRRCIGAAFALFEMKLVLARLIQRLDLQLAEPAPVLPSRRGVTVAPKGGVRLLVRSRA